jgi:Na+/melibiose symporter-like transporter
MNSYIFNIFTFHNQNILTTMMYFNTYFMSLKELSNKIITSSFKLTILFFIFKNSFILIAFKEERE